MVSSSSYSEVTSPDEVFTLDFTPNDIAADASLLIRETQDEPYILRSDIDRVSGVYLFSSEEMENK